MTLHIPLLDVAPMAQRSQQNEKKNFLINLNRTNKY